MRIVSFYMQCTLTGGIESHAILNVILLRGYHCFAVASKDNRKNWDKLSIPCHVWLIFFKLEYWGIIIGFELTESEYCFRMLFLDYSLPSIFRSSYHFLLQPIPRHFEFQAKMISMPGTVHDALMVCRMICHITLG